MKFKFDLYDLVRVNSKNIQGWIVDEAVGDDGENYYIIEETFEDGTSNMHYSIPENDLTFIRK